jgi:osmotically-inducible protein OsmY
MSRYLSLLLLAVVFIFQGCATTLTKGADRRTQGTYIDDGYIEDTATERIKKKYEEKVHINISSYNRKVLVTGEVADEAVKSDITRIIGGVQNVTDIHNELIIAPLSNLSSRSGDTLTTSNVMFRLRDSGKDFFRAERVKVVTEHDIVYLQGLVTHAEADVANDIASTSRGVKKVLPLFEFVD